MRGTPQGHSPNGFWFSWATRDLLLLTILGVLASGNPWYSAPSQNTVTTASDRTGKLNAEKTASDADRELARKIRKAVLEDKSLSSYAHNITIIARDGVVTLKGPVRSGDEKNTIDAKATQIAGATNVKDELTINSKEE